MNVKSRRALTLLKGMLLSSLLKMEPKKASSVKGKMQKAFLGFTQFPDSKHQHRLPQVNLRQGKM